MTQEPVGYKRLREAALAAADQLGIYHALRERTPQGELARRLGIDATMLGRLLDVLAWSGAVVRDRDELRVTEAPTQHARGAHAIALVLRRGRPIDATDPFSLQVEMRYLVENQLVHEGPDTIREVATWIAARLDGGTLLDAGGGHGAYALAVRDLAPRTRAIVIDRAPIVEMAKHVLGPRAAELEFRAGDLAECDLGSGYQVALLNHVLHTCSRSSAERIIERVAAALAPGGILVVKEVAVGPDHATGVLLAFAMSLIAADLMMETADALRARLARAGLDAIGVEALATAPDAVMIHGTRP